MDQVLNLESCSWHFLTTDFDSDLTDVDSQIFAFGKRFLEAECEIAGSAAHIK